MTTEGLKDLIKTLSSATAKDAMRDVGSYFMQSPVVREVLMSPEGMQLLQSATGVQRKIAQALFNEGLLTEDQRDHLGIVPMMQILSKHLSSLSTQKQKTRGVELMTLVLSFVGGSGQGPVSIPSAPKRKPTRRT